MIRVGILTPHAAAGAEAELPAMAPGRLVTRVARISPDATAVRDQGTATAAGMAPLAGHDRVRALGAILRTPAVRGNQAAPCWRG